MSQQAQYQQMQQQAQVDQAKMSVDIATAQEKMAKIDELKASAAHKNTESDLNLVKMMVELEDMQFNQLREEFYHAQEIRAARKSEEVVAP